MQTRVAVMAVIVEDDAAAEKLNAVLHHYGEHIIGRMGIPYRASGINTISIGIYDHISTINYGCSTCC